MNARPAIAEPGPWHFPTPEIRTLDNGLELHVYDLPGQHIVSATWVRPAPTSAEAPATEGELTILTRTLDEGTKAHPGDAFADLLESEGAAIGAAVSHAGLQVMLDVPSSHLPVTLPLLAEAVIAPALATSDIERHIALRLAEIEQHNANSAHLAARTFLAETYDPTARQSRPTGGTPESVEQITPEVVRAAHGRVFGPAGSRLILGGDFSTTDPFALAAAAFGDWQASVDTAAPTTPRMQPAHAVLVDRPGAVQADVRLGGAGIDRHDPRWAPFAVAAHAMGGAFLSRLNKVLREERGYTYGVHLAASPQRTGGTFAVGGSFRTDVLAQAVAEAVRLLDVSDAPFTDQEVRDAISYTIGVAPLRYATADGVVDQAAGQVLADTGTDFVDRHLAALRQVTPATAQDAYTSLVDPAALTLVVVGDAEAIEPGLREAGVEVEVR